MKFSFLSIIAVIFALTNSARSANTAPSPCADLFGYACSTNSVDDTGQTVKGNYGQVAYEKAISEWIATRKPSISKLLEDRAARNLILNVMDASTFNTCRFYNAASCVEPMEKALVAVMRGSFLFDHDYPFFGKTPKLNDAKLDVIYAEWMKPIKKDFIDFLYARLDRQKFSLALNEHVLPNIKEILLGVVKDLKLSQDVFDKIAERVNAIKIIEDKLKSPTNDRYEGLLHDYFAEVNAAYDSDTNAISITNGFLASSTSEYTLVRVLGHELTHSFDPCSIGMPAGSFKTPIIEYSNSAMGDAAAALSENPFSKIVSCLEDDKSIGAVSTSHSAGWGNIFFSLAKQMHPEVKLSYFCSENHQVREAFPDLLASEVLSRYIRKFRNKTSPVQKLGGVSNSVRFSCGLTEESDPAYRDVHSLDAARTNKILLANPRIYEDLSCSGNPAEIAIDCLAPLH